MKEREQLEDKYQQLRQENKKLRELWAACQKHSRGEKMWENIEKILSDLNQGKF